MAELVTGTATFVFTDVEESTQLVKRGRGRYADALAKHRSLLREALLGRGGREVDTQGDSFFFVFQGARDAVLAVVDAQRALASHAWPEGAEIRVRIGIHTGGAALAAGRYHGVAVHRAARICAAAHGGQILLSQSTRSMLEDEDELPQIELRDLGEHRFKGFERPDRVYQVVAEGLESAFPPVRTGASQTTTHSRVEHLTAAAGTTVFRAEDEARALRHNFIGTEHLLLAIVREREGIGALALQSCGVSFEAVRAIIEQIVVAPTGERPAEAQLPLTPRAQKVLEFALQEALALGQDVSGGHVLLGIAREPECIAAHTLRHLGVDADVLRKNVLDRMSPQTAVRNRSSFSRLRSLWRRSNRAHRKGLS